MCVFGDKRHSSPVLGGYHVLSTQYKAISGSGWYQFFEALADSMLSFYEIVLVLI